MDPRLAKELLATGDAELVEVTIIPSNQYPEPLTPTMFCFPLGFTRRRFLGRRKRSQGPKRARQMPHACAQ
jgi:hypothetical protein